LVVLGPRPRAAGGAHDPGALGKLAGPLRGLVDRLGAFGRKKTAD
jgi:hypothetical protein